MLEPQRLLVIQTAFLGDLVLGATLFKKIKQLYPHCHLAIVCRQGLGHLLLKTQLVDAVHEIKKGDSSTYQKAIRELREETWDIVLCPHRSFRSAWLAHQISAPIKVSFKSFWNFIFFKVRVPHQWSMPEPYRQLSLLRAVDPRADFDMASYLGQQEKATLPQIPAGDLLFASALREIKEQRVPLSTKVQGLLNDFLHKPKVVIAPGSVWPTKRWVSSEFAMVAKFFQASGYQVFWMGGKEERTLCEELVLQVEGSFSLAGKTDLFESSEILTQAHLLISNDSGAQHLAALAGCPVVTIFGPTVLDFGYRPWTNQARVVENRALKCRPCGLHGGKTCPIQTHECMTSLSAAEVIEASNNLLGQSRTTP